LLGIANIGAADNFFELGGHSLLAVQAHRELRDTLGLTTLSITDIFRFPTLSSLANHAEGIAGGTEKAEEQATGTSAAPDRSDTMSKRRAMRANRRTRTG
jgi:hypothetical protein